MLAVSVRCAPRVAGGLCGRPGTLPQQQHVVGAVVAPRRSLRALAFKNQQRNNGGSASQGLDASRDQLHATKMLNLTLEYFEELMSKGNLEVAHKILDPDVQHKDMVRNEGRTGISAYQRYIADLKKAYPNIYVRPTQFGVVDTHTLFVAFEGKATDQTPLFKGVDLFYFNENATKITEIEVYRSNWLGAQGHDERKKKAQHQQGEQPRLTT